jgi:uncharacterized protein YpmB
MRQYSIQNQRKRQAILLATLGAIFTAITVAAMLYFTYAAIPHRM